LADHSRALNDPSLQTIPTLDILLEKAIAVTYKSLGVVTYLLSGTDKLEEFRN